MQRRWHTMVSSSKLSNNFKMSCVFTTLTTVNDPLSNYLCVVIWNVYNSCCPIPNMYLNLASMLDGNWDDNWHENGNLWLPPPPIANNSISFSFATIALSATLLSVVVVVGHCKRINELFPLNKAHCLCKMWIEGHRWCIGNNKLN